tara:strand:- start:1476 stop:1886 length:411 start_codon:yes stop_codon:yes gene_type:complete
MKVTYPENYNDEDKAIYLDLITRGKQLIGIEINQDEEFLLDLSAKMTINKFRGYDNGLSKEEVEEVKTMHKNNMSGSFETPPEKFYDGLIKLDNGETMDHPLMKTPEETYQKNMTNPDDNGVNYLTNKIDEMLEVN